MKLEVGLANQAPALSLLTCGLAWPVERAACTEEDLGHMYHPLLLPSEGERGSSLKTEDRPLRHTGYKNRNSMESPSPCKVSSLIPSHSQNSLQSRHWHSLAF